MTQPEPKLCKKIVAESGSESPDILLGLIVAEDEFFYTIKTSKRTHQIRKSNIISITDTDIIFRGVA